MTPSRRREPRPIEGVLPEKVGVVIADQIYIDRDQPASSNDRASHSFGGIPES